MKMIKYLVLSGFVLVSRITKANYGRSLRAAVRYHAISHDTSTTHCFQTHAKSHIQRYKKPSRGQAFEEMEIAG